VKKVRSYAPPRPNVFSEDAPPNTHPLWVKGSPTDFSKPMVVTTKDKRMSMVTHKAFPALYQFRYDDGGEFFCNAEDVLWHRGCTGFDF